MEAKRTVKLVQLLACYLLACTLPLIFSFEHLSTLQLIKSASAFVAITAGSNCNGNQQLGNFQQQHNLNAFFNMFDMFNMFKRNTD